MQDVSKILISIKMDTYRTRDLYLAAFLITTGIEFISAELDPSGGFSWFVFSSPKECERLENEFAFCEALGDTRKFSQSLKFLKKKVAEISNPNINNYLNRHERDNTFQR